MLGLLPEYSLSLLPVQVGLTIEGLVLPLQGERGYWEAAASSRPMGRSISWAPWLSALAHSGCPLDVLLPKDDVCPQLPLHDHVMLVLSAQQQDF